MPAGTGFRCPQTSFQMVVGSNYSAACCGPALHSASALKCPEITHTTS